MKIDLVKELLTENNRTPVTIIYQDNDQPNFTNTWSTYIELNNDELLVPVGGMYHLEKAIEKDNNILLSIASPNIKGLYGIGAGVRIKGSVTFNYESKLLSEFKIKYPWIRSVLMIKIEEVIQTL